MIGTINLDLIVNEIRRDLEVRLENLGLFYRVFARGKSVDSIGHKLALKKGVYGDGKKMQDIVGIRVVLYFVDDVEVVYEILKSMPNFLDESNSEKDIHDLDKALDKDIKKRIGSLADKLFMPERLNLVFRMSDTQTDSLNMALSGFDFANLIDNTFEVQIRTVFSEGWHEVEHDLRYKCQGDPTWEYCKEESRTLNGMYASLEIVESAMRGLFDDIAFKNFKHQDWASMLRNKYCIRFEDNELSDCLIECLSKDGGDLGKELFKFSREALFSHIRRLPRKLPRKMDNIVFLINRVTVDDKTVRSLEPLPISELLDTIEL